jgi:catechol 2,3-dioxygenase-like lactoylglutathione lyase family enzyme
MYRHDDFIQVQTPGTNDIIVFETDHEQTPKEKTCFHFGFRLLTPSGIKSIIRTVEEAGGTIKDSGEFDPGEPFVFFFDPDGYRIEVWYEKIPPALKSFN